jgi:dihydrofolate reductase
MMLSAIVAMDRNRVIGYHNQMPWSLPADLQHFKEITMGHPIIMGRNTYESVGRVLPGRDNIVVTSRPFEGPENLIVVDSITAALDKVSTASEAFIIGGQQIFEQVMPYVQRVYLTIIDQSFSGDTYFPELSEGEWETVDTETHEADEKNQYNYAFLILERKK